MGDPPLTLTQGGYTGVKAGSNIYMYIYLCNIYFTPLNNERMAKMGPATTGLSVVTAVMKMVST